MRAAIALLVLVLLGSLALSADVAGQPTSVHYVTLYAHSTGNSLTLNARPPSGGQKAAEVGRDLVFRLVPTLGENLQIHGGITITAYFRGSATLFGIVVMALSELKQDGNEISVPGAIIDSPIVMNSLASPVTLGVGIIDYEFDRGSSILLHVRFEQQKSAGTPFIVWDDPATPTSLRLPAVSPTRADLEFSTDSHFGRVLQADSVTGQATVRVIADVEDAIGVYRLTDSHLKLTAPNGSVYVEPLTTTNSSDYASQYLFTARLSSGEWQIGLELRDVSGDTYSLEDNVWVSRFQIARINLSDSAGIPIQNASLIANFESETSWSALTNSTGWATLILPSSLVLGPLNLTIAWSGTVTLSTLSVVGDSTYRIVLPVYNLGLRVTMNGIPVPFADVKLTQGGLGIREHLTGALGTVNFSRVPAGNYTVQVQYLLSQYQIPITVNGEGTIAVSVPIPHRTTLILIALSALGASTYVWVRRKRTKLYPQSFQYFNKLVHGGLPNTCFMVITGNSGSGKSVLLNTLVAEHLTTGDCIYIANTEYPETIRQNMTRLGICNTTDTKSTRIIFIDAYSAIGGTRSKEERHVTSHTDLTSMGLEISRCLESAGTGADVYLDSLSPLVNVLRMDYLLNFLQSIAAKVKANSGRLCVTIGTGIEKGDLTKLEEVSDCVIETQLQESGRGQTKRLRIKKLRDQPYDDKWVRFQVEAGKGIVFLTRTKTETV